MVARYIPRERTGLFRFGTQDGNAGEGRRRGLDGGLGTVGADRKQNRSIVLPAGEPEERNMTVEKDFEGDDIIEFDELDDEMPELQDVEAANDERVVERRNPATRAWQRLEERGESRWLREQLSDWDDWDENADAI